MSRLARERQHTEQEKKTEQEATEQQLSFRNRTIPDKTLFNVELYGLADRIKDIKLENKQHEFCEKIRNVLALFDPADHKYDEKIVVFAMQAVENFIIKPKQGERKLAVVIECVKHYFNDDVDLIVKMVEILLPKIKKMNIVRRNWKRIARFFLRTVAERCIDVAITIAFKWWLLPVLLAAL